MKHVLMALCLAALFTGCVIHEDDYHHHHHHDKVYIEE